MLCFKKRVLAMLLAVMMVVTIVPVQVFADAQGAETHTHDDSLAHQALDLIDEILELSEVSADMSDEEIVEAIEYMPNEVYGVLNTLESIASQMNSQEIALVNSAESAETFGRFASVYEMMNTPAVYAASGTHTPVEGVTVGVSGASNNSMSDGAVTVTAKGSGGFFGIGASAKTATITVTNSSESNATIAFNWTATSVNQLIIDGATQSGSSGSFEKMMSAGASVTITITTAENSTENKLVMNGFSYAVAAASSNVTFEYDEALGSVTAGEIQITNGTVSEVSGTEGAQLTASVKSNAVFMGWIDAETRKVLSQDTSFRLIPASSITVKAVFVSTEPVFIGDGNYMYEGLRAATASGCKVIVLANNATLPAGDYTIPVGMTMLIPYNDAHTLCTTEPTVVKIENSKTDYSTPTPYRTLNMAEGARITIDGAMSLSAQQAAGTTGVTPGAPNGPVSFVNMASGSTITVNSGAKLYVWGYITGSGYVTAKSGATVYEDFQLTDWRGGSATTSMQDNDYAVFPMSQYYVQNIEVPLTLEAGASEICYMSVTVSASAFGISYVEAYGSGVPFIGSGGMFQIKNGKVTKDYDENTDRLILDVDGDVEMSNVVISMNLGLLGNLTLNSAAYKLPINSNITVNVNSGTINITQDIALLPDACIYIGPDAVCSVAAGSEIYIYDLAAWQSGKYCYSNAYLRPLGYAPGRPEGFNRTLAGDASVVVAGTLNADEGFIYGTTAGNASISGQNGGIVVVKAGGKNETYQATQGGSDGKKITYVGIPINPIKLKNEMGDAPSLVETSEYDNATSFTYIDGEWVNCVHSTLGNICEGYKAGKCPDCGAQVEASDGDGHKEETIVGKPATCTEDGLSDGKKCSVCGTITLPQDVIPAAHTSRVTIAKKDPTCTEDGYEAYEACGECEAVLTEKVVLPATGHPEDELVILEEFLPTCEGKGLTEGTVCGVCGQTVIKQEEIPALGHDSEVIPGKAATCTETGLTDGSVCTVCNTILTAQQEIPKIDHSYDNGVETTAPTCTVDGVKTYTCTVCGATKTEAISATGHTKETIPGKDATCTEAGQYDGWKCSVCGFTEAGNVISAIGHDYSVVVEGKDATCTEAGLTETKKCYVCGDLEKKQEEIPAKGHVLDDGVKTTPATCKTEGVMTYTCTVCGVYTETKQIEIDPNAHTVEILPAVPATCDESGLKEGKKCSACDKILAEQEEIPALGHKYPDVGELTTPPTCTENGVWTYKCTNTGCTMSYTEVAAAPGHKSKVVPGKEATCTEAGLTDGEVCDKCGETLKVQQVIESQGHKHEESVTTEPGCETKGEKTFKCSVCGDTYTEEIAAAGHAYKKEVTTAPDCVNKGLATFTCENCGDIYTEEIAAAGHTLVPVSGKAATCTEDGLTDGEECTVCDYTTQTVIPSEGHKWNEGEIETAATCSAEGRMVYGCTVCGGKEYAAIKALGHDIVADAAKAPTCTETGLTAGEHCSRCDYKKEQNVVDALGHDYSEVVAGKAPTCTETGLIEVNKCSRCGAFEKAQDVIPANGHTWNEGVNHTETCTEAGTAEFTCTVDGCGVKETLPTEALGHDLFHTTAKEPTCTEPGESAGSECRRCDYTEGVSVIPAKGHAYTGVETVPATCTTSGVMTYTCQNGGCGDSYTETIEVLGHDLVENKELTVEATCETAGSKTCECSRCEYSETEIIDAPGHELSTATTAATCTEDGKTVTTCSRCDYREESVITKLGHKEETVPGKAATCLDGGLTDAVKCSVCGETLVSSEPIKARGHEWNDGEVSREATCTAEGEKLFTCQRSDCGATKTEPIAKLGHSYESEVTKEATCKEEGVTTFTCNCGDSYTEAIEKLAHTEEAIEKAATCTETGLTGGIKCSVCDEEIKAATVVPVIPHAYDDGKVETEPTCTASGLKVYTCGVCGGTKEEILNAQGHNYVTVPGKAATCTETGLTPGIVCDRCGDIQVSQSIREIIDHNFSGSEGEVTKAPTCKEEGVRTYTCNMCGEAKKNVAIPVIDHTPVEDPAVAATCTTDGKTAGSHCDACGDVIKAQTVIPAAGHKYTGAVTVEPKCEEEGVRTYTCSKCNDSYTEAIAALGHKETDIPAQAATCSKEGTTAGKYCTVCKKNTVEPKPIEKLPHTEITVPGKPATCTEDGLTEGKKCSICGEVVLAQNVITAEGHKSEAIPAVEASCTREGSTAGEKCSVCGSILKAPETVAKKEHTIEVIPAKAPTCTESGLSEGSKCSVCTAILVPQKTESALGHDYVVDAKASATCTEPGLTEGKHCTRCDDKVAQEEIPALGHASVTDKAVAPTCVSVGLTEGSHCSRCGEVLAAQEEIPATGHDMSEATCTKPATCKYGCGHTVGEALGHDPEEYEEIFALCETPGMTAGERCRRCDQVLRGLQELKPLGHDYITVPAKKPTFSSVGWEEYIKCSRCSYTTYVEIPKLESDGITDFETFIENLEILEDLAVQFVKSNPGKDPAALVIKYIRTGVDRYNSGSWGIMAGYEDAAFAEFVGAYEDDYNSKLNNTEDMLHVTALKDIENFDLPNGDYADIGHVFGTMDITYHNKFGVNHADVAGWAGDLVDLLSLSDQFGVTDTGNIEDMVEEIASEYFLKNESTFPEKPTEGSFSLTDFIGDLDGFYIMDTLEKEGYKPGALTEIFRDYFTEDLTSEDRAAYFIDNRMNGVSLRSVLREEVYNNYVANKVVSTLEGTRVFNNDDLTDLRKACCYAFADYICKLAGDYVEITENVYFTVFSDESSVLAPGITQQKKLATTADNKQIAFYIATADLTRDDVDVYANYHDNDPEAGWEMSRVLDQANAAQDKYGDPESAHYIENYNVIASINGDGYNMSTGEPGGLLVMHGTEYHPIDGGGFFGILKDGTAIIGTQADYNRLKNQVQEGIGGFGTMLIKDGEIAISASSSYYTNRASRTAVGITATGKVVFLVVDGRQEPWSCGGSMEEIAQMMFEAGCVEAINLDGGGSTTYVAKEEGMDELAVVSKPSDGYARSVSTSLMMVSTAPSSTAFDHAVVSTDYDYLTVDSVIHASAKGVSATGNTAELPEDAYWTVSDSRIAEIDDDGVLTGKALGEVNVQLMQGDTILAFKTVAVVIPDNIYFTRSNINAVYGAKTELPVKAVYDSNPVSINESDVSFSLSIPEAGYTDGFTFVGIAESNVKTVRVIGELNDNPGMTAGITVTLFKQGEAAFDFDQATGGDRQLAWDRKVSNSTTEDAFTYFAVDLDEDMVTTYTFAIDMEKIEIPSQIADLTYMLPGADDANSSAWTFLCQLAQRISDLTEVRPSIKFDDNLEVDYSNITLANEYFTLTDKIFDEETNTVTLVLNWKRQTQAIDPDYANPICILSGVKLTPKDDAAWDKDQLSIVNSGTISYSVYMRASALYTFSQNTANQAQFGLKPYNNEANYADDKGGYLENIYKEFEDSYRLNKSAKNGWVVEEGGFAYYKNGERYTGIREIDGYYYDFGENGINIGQTKYTGWIKDANGQKYAKVGVVQNGWQQIGDTMYHCHADGYAHDVTVNDPVTCIKGGRRSFVCVTCGATEKSKSYTMPQGHVWNENHVCTVCGFKGIDISEGGPVTINFGTIDNPRTATDIPRYVYKSSGVRPTTYATVDGKKALTWSNDATLNSNGTMRDLYVSWSDNNEVGYGKINFVGKGNYYGERTLIFKVIPGDATNLRAAKVTMYTATLAWDAAPAADFYRVYKCASNGANPTLIGTTEGTTFKLENLKPGATTYYKVACSAYDENGEIFTNAKWSNVLALTANESDPADAVIDNVIIVTDEAVSDMLITDEGNFLILPGNSDSSEISIAVDGSDEDIIVRGDRGEVVLKAPDYTAPITLEDLTTVKDGKGTLEVKIGAYAAMEITVYQPTGLSELYIVSDDPDDEGRDYVDESKAHVTTGSVTLVSGDGTVTYEGDLSQIKARGNSTFEYYNKKAYQIKLDPKGDLLNNGEEVKTWILLANYADATLMHDKLTKDLAAALGMDYTASCDWVNLYYDGEYRGVYLLTEKNSIGSTSVDITDMEEIYEDLNPGYGDNMSVSIGRNYYDQEYQYTEGLTDPDDITGGYLLELHHSEWDEVSGFDTKQGVAFNVKSPEWCSENAMIYISEYYQEFEDAVYATDANGNYTGINPTTGKHYYEYVDKDSLVKAFILQQFNRNPDGFVSSMYFYKDAGEIMYCGPIWDQDVTYGTGWSGMINSTGTSYHYLEEALIRIPDFEEAVIEVYNSEVAPLLDELTAKNGTIDQYYDKLAVSAEMNYLKWPYVRVADPDHDSHLWADGTDYETVVDDLKDWIDSRIDVLDDKWGMGETYILGDVNNDGKVNIGDVVLLRRYIVGISDSHAVISHGDVNKDGKVNIGDVVLLRRYIVGIDDGRDIGREFRS